MELSLQLKNSQDFSILVSPIPFLVVVIADTF